MNNNNTDWLGQLGVKHEIHNTEIQLRKLAEKKQKLDWQIMEQQALLGRLLRKAQLIAEIKPKKPEKEIHPVYGEKLYNSTLMEYVIDEPEQTEGSTTL